MVSGVATRKPHGGLKWCHDTVLGVATQFESLRSTTQLWCLAWFQMELGRDLKLVSRLGWPFGSSRHGLGRD